MSQENQDRAIGESLEHVRRDEERARQDRELIVPTQPQPPAQEAPPPERPLLSVALGNIVLTEHGAEVTLVFPKEVVFADDDLSARLEQENDESE